MTTLGGDLAGAIRNDDNAIPCILGYFACGRGLADLGRVLPGQDCCADDFGVGQACLQIRRVAGGEQVIIEGGREVRADIHQ